MLKSKLTKKIKCVNYFAPSTMHCILGKMKKNFSFLVDSCDEEGRRQVRNKRGVGRRRQSSSKVQNTKVAQNFANSLPNHSEKDDDPEW